MAYLYPNSLIDIWSIPVTTQLMYEQSVRILYSTLRSLKKSKEIVGEYVEVFINGSVAKGTTAWFIDDGSPILLSDIDIVIIGGIDNVSKEQLSKLLKETEEYIRKNVCCAPSFKISMKQIDNLIHQEDMGIKDALIAHGVNINDFELLGVKTKSSNDVCARDFDMCMPYALYRTALFSKNQSRHYYQSTIYELGKSIWRLREKDQEISDEVGLMYDVSQLREYVICHATGAVISLFGGAKGGSRIWLSIINNVLNGKPYKHLLQKGLMELHYLVKAKWPNSILLKKIVDECITLRSNRFSIHRFVSLSKKNNNIQQTEGSKVSGETGVYLPKNMKSIT